jgi:hypothetical protein
MTTDRSRLTALPAWHPLEAINTTEERAVQHVALRAPRDTAIIIDDTDRLN